jgi:hypothetical protein
VPNNPIYSQGCIYWTIPPPFHVGYQPKLVGRGEEVIGENEKEKERKRNDTRKTEVLRVK